MPNFELISHVLCPYVQRAAIVLAENQVAFTRIDIDLSNKPDWFRAISPLGKTPLLRVDGTQVIFESAVICEYLDETTGQRMLPAGALDRARARGWIEMASAILNSIWGYYTAPDAAALAAKAQDLCAKFAQTEAALGDGPFFGGAAFGLVDAAFGPVFRYFDTLDHFVEPSVLEGFPKLAAWRAALAARPSVQGAVSPAYPALLEAFLRDRNSWLSGLLPQAA